MKTVADGFDNAMAESFFATLECELLACTRIDTYEQAWLALFSFIWACITASTSQRDRLSLAHDLRTHTRRSKSDLTRMRVSTVGQCHGRNRRPAARPWTTRNAIPNGANSPRKKSTAYRPPKRVAPNTPFRSRAPQSSLRTSAQNSIVMPAIPTNCESVDEGVELSESPTAGAALTLSPMPPTPNVCPMAYR
jgi:hypothetical protein